MKDTPYTTRFTVTRTYSNSYHGEAEKGSHGQSGFTDVAVSACKNGVLNPEANYSKTVAFH